MKITKEHYQTLKQAIKESLKDSSMSEVVKHYCSNNIGKSPMNRALHDMLYASKINGFTSSQWIVDNLYSYLNDTHIQTALVNIYKDSVKVN